MTWQATFFDGETAIRRPAELTLKDGALHIALSDGVLLTWPRGSYTLASGRITSEPIRIECELASLTLEDRSILPAMGVRSLNLWRLGLWAGGAVIALLVFSYFWGIPAMATVAAERVPMSWENKLGDLGLNELAPKDKRCEDPRAVAAANDLARRLMETEPGSPYQVDVILFKDPMINAFALPGGKVVVSSGLLRQTQRPEELAGVLAHELQHVNQRHPTRGIIRALSMSAVATIIMGDITSYLSTAALLGNLHYQRSDETSADRRGLLMMTKAGMDPRGMVDVFHILEKADLALPGQLKYLSSHPLTKDRIRQIEGDIQPGSPPPAPLRYAQSWDEIAHACD